MLFWGGRIKSPCRLHGVPRDAVERASGSGSGFGEQLPLLVCCAMDAQKLPSALAALSHTLNPNSYEQQGNVGFPRVSRNYWLCSTSDCSAS